MESQNLEINQNQIESKANRNHKDSLFRFIFNGEDDRRKGWLLSLYNALNNSNYTDINDLEITTIQNVIFITMKDDLSFLIDSEMNLYEHQSTVNPNMPLRGLMYFSQLYQKYLGKKNKQLYGSSIVKIPSPKFIVFYNGTAKQEDIIKYRLSDAFEKTAENGEFEWTATVINVNTDHNLALQKKCKALYDYSSFVTNVRKRIAGGQTADEAIRDAVDDAINNKLLDGLFEEQKQEIMGMILTEFNKEEYERVIRAEGAEEKAIEAAINSIKLGLSDDQITAITGLSLEKITELKKQI